MTKRRVVLLAAAVALAAAAHAGPVYTGSLSSATGGLVGTGPWVSTPGNPATLSWTVSENPDTSWRYCYTLQVPIGEISHLILETSSGLATAEVLNASGPFGSFVAKLNLEQQGNPHLPDPVYGIKFEEMTGLTAHIKFDAFRFPVWGDFYAKDGVAGGGFNSVWNAGFGSPDSDPLLPPSSGSLSNHVLVPDSVVPEPASGLLLACSVLALGLRRRRTSEAS